MIETIAIVNRKGGVGKTVTTHALGAGLTRRGYKVLYIDLDSQCNLTYDTGAKDAAQYTALDVLTGTITAAEAITLTPQGEIIAASPALAGADTQITGTGKEYRLKEALQPLHGMYDYILIDTPPALGTLTVNALTASDSVIIPVQADVNSIRGIGMLYEAIQAVQKYTNPALIVKGVLLTRYNGRAIISKDMRENAARVAAELGTVVYNTPIRECIAIKEAEAVQTDIYSYSSKSNAAADYTAFVAEVLGEGGTE